MITSANLETYLGKTATAGHVASLQCEMRAINAHMMALKTLQDSRLDRIEALLATLVTPDNGTFTGDGPTTQPSSVSSAAAGGVVLTSANLDTCLGETATVTSLKNDMCGINDRLNRIEALLATLPVTLVFPDNGTFTPSPAAPAEAGGDPKASGPVPTDKDGGTPLRLLTKDGFGVTLAMHRNFCNAFQVSLADKMCVEAWPGGSLPFVSWWSKMYHTKYDKEWRQILHKYGVDKDILAKPFSENELWEIVAHFLTTEFRLDAYKVVGTLFPYRI